MTRPNLQGRGCFEGHLSTIFIYFSFAAFSLINKIMSLKEAKCFQKILRITIEELKAPMP
jgi:hypothetical protein